MGIPYTAPPGVRLRKAEHPQLASDDIVAAVPVAPSGVVYVRAPEGAGSPRQQIDQVRPIK